MPGVLDNRRVAILATDGVEQVELERPMAALREAGATVTLLAPKPGRIQAFNHLDQGDTFLVDGVVESASARDFDALMLPGGVANPDALRMNAAAVELVRDFAEMDKPIAAICHAPWLLVEAGLVKGRTLTSWPSLATDIRNAGGEWVDRAVVVDLNLVTSRKPADIPAFTERMLALIARAGEDRRLDEMVEQTFPASDPLPPP
jgi:protease I